MGTHFSKLRQLFRRCKALLPAALLGLAGLVPTALTAQAPPAALPQLGDGSDMTSAAERQLGERIVRTLYRDPDYLDDPVLGDYVQGIWQPLLAAARQRGDLTPELDERFAWQVLLSRERSVNAFALPGGYLGIHLGLLAVVSSRDELASVLGHELSHVTQRHIARLLGRNARQTPWLIGAMILGALAASKNADTGNALIVGGQALSAQGQLNFSRDMEREADRIGYGVMTQAGFQAQGFVSMFDKLQQASRLNDAGAYPYLRSHPLTAERMADIQSRLPLGTPHGADVQPTVLHALMAARAKVLANSGPDALRAWQPPVDDLALARQTPAQQAGALYGAVLAASRLRDVALARRNLLRLQSVLAPDPPVARVLRWLRLEIELAAGDLTASQAVAWLDAAAAEALAWPGALPRAELLWQAELALRGGQPERVSRVVQRLQSWLAVQPGDAMAWQALAGLYTAQNQPLRALRAQAEVQVAQLDYSAALDRLKAAQERIRSSAPGSSAEHIDASIIDTRRRQLEVLLKEQALER